ncbi:hypothetical protein VNO78_03747 [Psophocarpus tetragonolobus]|uniref:Uncharacterized protein n=1 Tax=Psophocarpus tetragonolobus TaxID=3891 RepID=A0AAN9T1L2_PSOTE
MVRDDSSVWAPMGAPLNVQRDEYDQHWSSFDSSVNAVSFGFVATAILISMFLVMAIFERFLKPTSPPAAWTRRRDSHMPFNRKLSHSSPKMSLYASWVSVLMPGDETPSFIAHPVPAPCCPERISWPSHQHSTLPYSPYNTMPSINQGARENMKVEKEIRQQTRINLHDSRKWILLRDSLVCCGCSKRRTHVQALKKVPLCLWSLNANANANANAHDFIKMMLYLWDNGIPLHFGNSFINMYEHKPSYDPQIQVGEAEEEEEEEKDKQMLSWEIISQPSHVSSQSTYAEDGSVVCATVIIGLVARIASKRPIHRVLHFMTLPFLVKSYGLQN